MFLYIDPIKQGLKRDLVKQKGIASNCVFIHRSNKTRIETRKSAFRLEINDGFYT